MSGDAPRVSIGMPVYNGERYIEQAIDSVLAQTYTNFVFHISDNGSTDRTRAICEAYAAKDSRVRYHRYEQNRGASWNFNNVFKLTNTEYFKWVTYDDLIEPQMVERCVAVLDREPEVILAYPRTRIIDGDGNTLDIWADGLEVRSPRAHLRLRRYLHHKRNEALYGVMRSKVLARTKLLRPVAYCDQMLMAELALNGEFRELPDPDYIKRFHPASSTAVYTQHTYRAFFDPSFKGKVSFPRLERFAEFARRINNAPLSFAERLRCYLELSVIAINPQNALRMAEDLRIAGKTVARSIGLTSRKS